MLLVLLKPRVCFVSEMPDHNENRRNSLYAGLKAEPDQEHRILTSQQHKQPGKAVRILKDKGGNLLMDETEIVLPELFCSAVCASR